MAFAEENTCTAIKMDGTPCRAGAWQTDAHGNLSCPMHRATKEQKAEWGRRGARVTHQRALVKRLEAAQLPQEQRDALLDIPDLSSESAVRLFVARQIAELRAGLLPPTIASAVNALLQTLLRIEDLKLQAQVAELAAELHGDAKPWDKADNK